MNLNLSLLSLVNLCLKSKIYLRFFSDLRPFAQLRFTKDLRLRFGSDLVSNLRLPRGLVFIK